jgi:hypothetical protein
VEGSRSAVFRANVNSKSGFATFPAKIKSALRAIIFAAQSFRKNRPEGMF